MKFGVDAREYRLDDIANKYPDGYFQFGTNWDQQTSSSASPTFGGDLASFLMGLPTKGEYDIDARSTFHTYYTGLFAQDGFLAKARFGAFATNAGTNPVYNLVQHS